MREYSLTGRNRLKYRRKMSPVNDTTNDLNDVSDMV